MGAIQQCKCLPETVEGVSFPREHDDREVVRIPRWVKYIDNKSMCAYWHNVTTGETVWEQPEEYASHSSVLEYNDDVWEQPEEFASHSSVLEYNDDEDNQHGIPGKTRHFRVSGGDPRTDVRQSSNEATIARDETLSGAVGTADCVVGDKRSQDVENTPRKDKVAQWSPQRLAENVRDQGRSAS